MIRPAIGSNRVRTDITRARDIAPADRDALRALTAAVYPAEAAPSTPEPHIAWAPTDWSIRVWDDAGMLVSHVGLITRDAIHDDAPVLIGGIGGVKTHPAARGNGYAAAGLGEAVRFLADEPRVAFALLVCLPPVVPYYERMGWQRFLGTLLVEQPGGTVAFTANLPMTLPIHCPAPAHGTINLRGYPW